MHVGESSLAPGMMQQESTTEDVLAHHYGTGQATQLQGLPSSA